MRVWTGRSIARARVGDELLRDRGRDAELRPGDGAGRDDAGNSTFTVHIISPTTAATGVRLREGAASRQHRSVSTTNDGSDESQRDMCVAAPAIHIVKTADAAPVNAGDQIGFTMTVSNTGAGDAYGVTVSDVLPTNPGLSWTIESQGAGWSELLRDHGWDAELRPGDGAGRHDAGRRARSRCTSPRRRRPRRVWTLPGDRCRQQHRSSCRRRTTASDDSSASICVQGITDLQITKTGSPATQDVQAGSVPGTSRGRWS